MAHSTLKLRAGVDTNETPVLNEAGVSSCQLIRYRLSRLGLGLIEKLGGWSKFYPTQLPSVTRSLHAWEDLDGDAWVAAGMETDTTGSGYLGVMVGSQGSNGITTGSGLNLITPSFNVANPVPGVAATAGSPLVTVTDGGLATPVSTFDSVYFVTPVSVGGVVLFGLYSVYAVLTSTSYQVVATNVLQQPLPATSSGSPGTLPAFTSVANSPSIAVLFANHGETVGSTFTILLPQTVGGIVLYGDYIVTSVTGANNFTFLAAGSAVSNATVTMNGDLMNLVYNLGGAVGYAPAGYGESGYGEGGYGIGGGAPVIGGTTCNASDWSLGNWGATLLACPESAVVGGVSMSGIYEWQPDTSSNIAAIIPQAPPVNDGFFVAMPQRQIVAWGSTFTGIQDRLLVRWCDIENYNAWVATVTNQAGSYRIPTGSRIVGGIQGPQQGLLWTDIGIWSMQYIGQPYVYSFNEIGTGCGLIARKAAASLNGVVFWMGPAQFYRLDANGVNPINCPVWDVVFQNLNLIHLGSIRVAVNSLFNEISWFYPSTSSSGYNDSYVKYNVVLDAWDFGLLDRSAWINQSVVGPPLGAAASTLYLYQHEISPDADGQALISNFTTGFFSLSDADVKIFIDEVWPDMKWGAYSGPQNATVNLTFGVSDFPGQTPTNIGPFSFTSASTYVSPRLRGRLLQLTIGSSDIGSFWRLGGMRYRGAPDGRY